MIHPDIAVDFTKATKAQKLKIAEIFITNYKNMITQGINESGYLSTGGSWDKNHQPLTKKILLPTEFIKQYGKKVKTGTFKTFTEPYSKD